MKCDNGHVAVEMVENEDTGALEGPACVAEEAREMARYRRQYEAEKRAAAPELGTYAEQMRDAGRARQLRAEEE